MRKVNKQYVLGLDLAPRSTGYALCSNMGPIKQHVGHITSSPKDSLEIGVKKFSDDILKLISKLDARYGLSLVVIESTPVFTNYHTAFLMAAFEAVTRYVLYMNYGRRYKKLVTIVPVHTIRRFLNLKTKKEVFDYINTKYKFGFKSFDGKDKENDLTDAVALGMYGISLLEKKK